jgi:hypothetical protein
MRCRHTGLRARADRGRLQEGGGSHGPDEARKYPRCFYYFSLSFLNVLLCVSFFCVFSIYTIATATSSDYISLLSSLPLYRT